MKNPLIVPLKILRGHEVSGGLGVMALAFHPVLVRLLSRTQHVRFLAAMLTIAGVCLFVSSLQSRFVFAPAVGGDRWCRRDHSSFPEPSLTRSLPQSESTRSHAISASSVIDNVHIDTFMMKWMHSIVDKRSSLRWNVRSSSVSGPSAHNCSITPHHHTSQRTNSSDISVQTFDRGHNT